jgi:signal transduction histidine kinase
LLSLGESESMPPRRARHVRVTNALALLGVVLNFSGVPIDACASPIGVTLTDAAAVIVFASCWWFNARGQLTLARVMLVIAADGLILVSVRQLGGPPELRTMFFPLAVLPFLVFGTDERISLALSISVPIVAYFVLGSVPVAERTRTAVSIYMIYAPILSFTLLIAGVYVFARIDENTEDKLVDLRQRAARSARLVALGEMSSGIAHEVRNPLAAIHLAATQIIERAEDPVRVAQLGERIQRIVMRASRIIESMRIVARDGAADPFVCVSVKRIVDDALEVCTKRLSEHAIEVRTSPIRDDLEIECRSVQLTQVLVNLLGNAFDAVSSTTERWVSVDVIEKPSSVQIAIGDSGPPIPATVKARLFQPFFTTKPPERGTGIGLSLSRELVEAHQGTLVLDDKAPNTRFVLSLPSVQTPFTG